MKKVNLTRMWVNQPSTLQPWHKYHGMRVLAALDIEGDTLTGSVPVWFANNQPVVGMDMLPNALSLHWIES